MEMPISISWGLATLYLTTKLCRWGQPKDHEAMGVILDHLSGLSVIKGPSKKERRPGRDRKCGDGSKKLEVVEEESPSQGPQPVRCKERDNVLGWPEEAALSAYALTQ